MTALALPQPTSLVAVNDQCSAVEAWADQCDSIPELQDAGNKLAAIDKYLAVTSTEGRARVAAAQRRLEVRIGHLLGPAKPNGGGIDRDQSDGLRPEQRHQFRKMAENEGVVEDVIADSTDEEPASRRKVVNAIGGGIPTKETPPQRQALFDALRAIGDMERAVRNIDPAVAASGADPLKKAEINKRAKRLAAWLTKFQQAMDKES